MSQYEPFAEIYDEWSEHMTEDIEFYVQLAREAEGPIVELAVGNGRVAIPLVRETGRKVIGIDLSPAMLAQARERARAEGVDLELRQGDMRELELDEPADLIYSPFRSLLHLPTWRDRRRVFERVAGSLRAGGRFAWNAFVFDPQIAARLSGEVRQHTDDSRIWERVEYAPTDSRIDITAWVDKPGEGERKLSLWWINRSEWEGLIEVAGLEVEALYGDFDRRPLGEADREFIWVARKPS
ncbi:MAG: class I SAM-dependent methyltransferase [Actinobacteria bacterium]|nr:MAG: class I SAM-dependent methyltransferase [Actinomycetota bacterium]